MVFQRILMLFGCTHAWRTVDGTRVEPLLTEPIGDASYLVGDDSARLAAVIDPQIDTTRYVEAAHPQGLSIRYVRLKGFVPSASAAAIASPAGARRGQQE